MESRLKSPLRFPSCWIWRCARLMNGGACYSTAHANFRGSMESLRAIASRSRTCCWRMRRIVRAAGPAPLGSPRGSLVRFGSLRKAPLGSNTELRLMREVDGSSQQLSQKFWKIVCSKVAGLDKRLAGAISITAVEYEDRYLKSPLQFKVLFEML